MTKTTFSGSQSTQQAKAGKTTASGGLSGAAIGAGIHDVETDEVTVGKTSHRIEKSKGIVGGGAETWGGLQSSRKESHKVGDDEKHVGGDKTSTKNVSWGKDDK